MPAKTLLTTVSCLTILALFLASCAPGSPPPQPTAPAAPTQVGAKAQVPAQQPTAPAATPKPAAEQPRSGGILTTYTGGDPLTLDMQQEISYLTNNVVQAGYNGITQFDPNTGEDAIGDLAKSWEVSPDGLTYTFKLHENVKFHDGAPFSSEDIKFSFDRQLAPPRGVISPRRTDLAAISRLEAPDKDTVKFILKYPAASLLASISSGWMVIYSKAFVEKKADMKKEVMGTGPFKLKGYVNGTSLEYVKNPDYFVKGRPYLDGMTFYIIRDAATRLAALRTGRVKMSGPGMAGITPADAEVLKKAMPQAVLYSYPSFLLVNIILNTQQPPWTDIRMRKAVHLALDRQASIEVLGQGYGELGTYMPGKWDIPKDELVKMPGWRQPKDQDIAEAKKLVAEAGYPDGITVKSLVRAEKAYENVAIFSKDQLAKIGIRLELDVRETAVRTKLLNEGAHNNHPALNSLAFPDPAYVARYWAAPVDGDWGTNWQRYNDPKVLDLFDKQSRALDPAERKKIVRELDMVMIEAAARPAMYWTHDIVAWWPEVKNRGVLIGAYNNNKYQDIWLAK